MRRFHTLSRQRFRAFAPLLVVCFLAVSGIAAARFQIVSPAPRTVIATNSIPCEIGLEVSRDSVDSITFEINYVGSGFQEDDTSTFNGFRQTVRNKHVATDTTFPFQTIIDISDIQDQYFRRMWIVARAYFAGDSSGGSVVRNFVVDRNRRLSTRTCVSTYRRPAGDRETFQNRDNTISFASWWDHDSLYFAVTVHDHDHIQTSYRKPRYYWTGDDIEIFLDAGNDKQPLPDSSVFQVLLSPRGSGYIRGIWPERILGDVSVSKDSIAAGANGYALKCAIAWQRLGIVPSKGRTIGLDIDNFDKDRVDGLQSLATWAGLHLGNQHNPSEWGTLVLHRPLPTITGWVLGLFLATGAAALGRYLRKSRERRRGRGGSASGSVMPPSEAVEDSTFPGEPKEEPVYSAPVAKAMDLTRDHFDESQCNLEFIAAHLNRHPNYISGLFRRETGMRFSRYLNHLRLEKAKSLLETTNRSATFIAVDCGFASYEYFARVFKKHFGESPSRFRKRVPN